MVTEEQLATTQLSVQYYLEPTKNIIGDLSGLIGTFFDDLLSAFYPRTISKKANVATTELFNNAVENNADDTSKIGLKLSIDGTKLRISVRNAATREQADIVKRHVAAINRTRDRRQLLADTIRERRNAQLPGGLGLIRLVVENKFAISAGYRSDYLRVDAEFELEG